MIAPYMPLLICMKAGGVPQWYMKTPGERATKVKRRVFPGGTGWYQMFHGVVAAWKSMEWARAVLFTKVTCTSSPWRTRKTGPGTDPLNVHRESLTPGAISRIRSSATMRISLTCWGPAGGTAGSYHGAVSLAAGLFGAVPGAPWTVPTGPPRARTATAARAAPHRARACVLLTFAHLRARRWSLYWVRVLARRTSRNQVLVVSSPDPDPTPVPCRGRRAGARARGGPPEAGRAGSLHEVGERHALQRLYHRGADLLPQVVEEARAGLGARIAPEHTPVQQAGALDDVHDLADRDGVGGAGQRVAALSSPPQGPQNPMAHQLVEDLREERPGEAPGVRQVAGLEVRSGRSRGQLDQGCEPVLAFLGELHGEAITSGATGPATRERGPRGCPPTPPQRSRGTARRGPGCPGCEGALRCGPRGDRPPRRPGASTPGSSRPPGGWPRRSPRRGRPPGAPGGRRSPRRPATRRRPRGSGRGRERPGR